MSLDSRGDKGKGFRTAVLTRNPYLDGRHVANHAFPLQRPQVLGFGLRTFTEHKDGPSRRIDSGRAAEGLPLTGPAAA